MELKDAEVTLSSVPQSRLDPSVELLLDQIMARKEAERILAAAGPIYVCTECYTTFKHGRPSSCHYCGKAFG